MKLVITNDDGIESDGLRLLVTWAQKIGNVTVIAPKYQQSAKSHSIDLVNPFEVKKVNYLPGVEAYQVDSTPADCIRFAFCKLGLSCDLVLSGINAGVNVGIDSLYSGTYSAAAEAVALDHPAIAVSTHPNSLAYAQSQLDCIYEYFKDHKLLDYHNLFNINIPDQSDGIALTRFGGAYFRDHFLDKGNDMYQADGYSVYEPGTTLEDDLHAIMNHYISVSPFTIDKTDYNALKKLRSVVPFKN